MRVAVAASDNVLYDRIFRGLAAEANHPLAEPSRGAVGGGSASKGPCVRSWRRLATLIPFARLKGSAGLQCETA